MIVCIDIGLRLNGCFSLMLMRLHLSRKRVRLNRLMIRYRTIHSSLLSKVQCRISFVTLMLILVKSAGMLISANMLLCLICCLILVHCNRIMVGLEFRKLF